MSRSGRLAYSTERGLLCPQCKRPTAECTCGKKSNDEPLPARITARLRLEKSGRKGKAVTVVDGLPGNKAFLEKLARELKTACGSGGTASANHVEVQGDHRQRLREHLGKKGWVVKG